MPITQIRPEASDEVYSNFDHSLNAEVVKELETGDKFAQHSAWNFCGYVYKDQSGWHEEVWRHGSTVETLSGDSVENVIQQANSEYGND